MIDDISLMIAIRHNQCVSGVARGIWGGGTTPQPPLVSRVTIACTYFDTIQDPNGLSSVGRNALKWGQYKPPTDRITRIGRTLTSVISVLIYFLVLVSFQFYQTC